MAGAGRMSVPRRVPLDPVLPQLGQLLDETRMRELFARALPWRGAAGVSECTIERVKYRPGRNCVVGYRLTLSTAAGERQEQRVSASVYGADEARARHRSAETHASLPRGRAAAGAGAPLPPVSFVAAMNMLVRAFPCDRKLAALPLLGDPHTVAQRFLPGLVATRWGLEARILSSRQRVVSYFPEHACTVCLDVRVADRAGERDWRVYGKVRHDDSGASTFALMQQLWDGSEAAGVSGGFARPLHYDPALRLLWQEAAEGSTLAALLDAGIETDEALVRTAAALAGLHASPVRPSRLLEAGELIDGLSKAAAVVSQAAPECAARIDALLCALLESQPACEAVGTLHGDLHSNNILVGPQRVAFIDIDRLARGPVLAELGSLLAELAMRDCLRGRSVDGDRLARVAGAYAHEVRRPIDGTAWRWHCAAAMLRERALRCVTSLKQGRMEALPVLLDNALAILRADLPTVAADRHSVQAADATAAALATFTDIARIAPALEPVARTLFGGAGVTAVALEYAWRKIYAKPSSWAKSRLRLCYRVHLLGEDGAARTVFLHGEARLSAAGAEAADGRPVLSVDGASIALRGFPDDPGLPQLAGLLRGEALPECLASPRAVAVVRYRPQVRCTLRVILADGTAVFAKTFADDTAVLAHRRARELWSLPGQPLVPEPLACDAAGRTLWMRAAPGTLAAVEAPERALQASMRCLAALHGSVLSLPVNVARGELLEETRKRAVKLGLCVPAWSLPLRSLMQTCAGALDTLAPARTVPLHGDAHLEQFMVHASSAVLLDLDEMRLGEAAQDVAAMLVDVALRHPADEPLRSLARAAYEQAAGARFDDALLAWHQCLQFVNKAYRLLCRATPACAPDIDLALREARRCAHALPRFEDHPA